jgi:hypothetical protein
MAARPEIAHLGGQLRRPSRELERPQHSVRHPAAAVTPPNHVVGASSVRKVSHDAPTRAVHGAHEAVVVVA